MATVSGRQRQMAAASRTMEETASNVDIECLEAPDFSEDELAQLVTDLMALKKPQIQDFLYRSNLPRSGTKAEIRERIQEALADGALPPEEIVRFLDEVTPWGKQHVYLYKGPSASISDWKNTDWVADLLKRHKLSKYLNATLPLALPESMQVSSVIHDGRKLRITAIKRREWYERNPEYDGSSETAEGDALELRAFIHRIMRSLVAFEWDLISNTAFLQISQLPSGIRYEEVAKEFFDLIASWFDINRFAILELRKPIQKLHELEENGTGETRSHGINYRTLEGRRLEGKSASPADSLLGEVVIDVALAAIRESGVPHLGNFYWLPNETGNPTANPLKAEVHVIIIGYHKRISFPTPNTEGSVRYVLSRIRSHCA